MLEVSIISLGKFRLCEELKMTDAAWDIIKALCSLKGPMGFYGVFLVEKKE